MASIFPFRALRYDPSKVSPSQVVTQPYDKITPAMQDKYYAASPYSLVRVILGKPEAGDNDQQNVYTRASASLRQWQSEGVLVPDPEPSLYLYTQTFKIPGDASGATGERRGFIALGQVQDYDDKIVYRHEQTLSKPKADRLNLLRATQAHCGQIFMVYSDPAGEVDQALRPDGPPTVEVRDQYDVLHRIWKVSDPAVIQTVQAKMADKKLIIADGHHRYETALNYRNEIRNGAKPDLQAPSERLMMTFVNMDAPGLVVLPTHRVVFGLENFDILKIGAKLQENFEVENFGPLTDAAAAVDRLHQAGKDTTAVLAVTSHGDFLLRARAQQKSKNLEGLSARQRALDVVQLHKLVLEEALGMSQDDIREQKHLKYVRDAQRSHRGSTKRRQRGIPHQPSPHAADARRRLCRRSLAAEVHGLLSQNAERPDDLLATGGRTEIGIRRTLGCWCLAAPRGSRLRLSVARSYWWRLSWAATLFTRSPPNKISCAVYSPQTTYSVPLLEVNGQPYAGLVELLEPLGSVDARADGKKYKLHFTPPGGRPLELQFTDGKDKGKVRGNGYKLPANFVIAEWPGLCTAVRHWRCTSEAARQPMPNYTRHRDVSSSATYKCTTPRNCTRAIPRDCCWASLPRLIHPSQPSPDECASPFAVNPLFLPAARTFLTAIR